MCQIPHLDLQKITNDLRLFLREKSEAEMPPEIAFSLKKKSSSCQILSFKMTSKSSPKLDLYTLENDNNNFYFIIFILMNTTNLPSTHVDTHTISLLPLQRGDLKELAQQVAHWQKNPLFMRFLKEQPMTAQQNLDIFYKDFDTEHCTFSGIQLHTAQDLVGFLLFHNFDERDRSLELWFRVDPENQARGVCTQAVKLYIPEILQNSAITDIVWWHSALNQWSFKVFQRSWFQLEQFVPRQTFLPNIKHLTDDFKWKINQTLLAHPSAVTPDAIERDKIFSGVMQHILSFI